MTLFRLTRRAVGFAIFTAHAVAAPLSFTAIQYPGSTYTIATAINNNGDIVGYYRDSNNNVHGFLRSAAGVLTSFDYPAQLQTGPGLATFPTGINDAGDIVGHYDLYPYGAFFRDPSGNYLLASSNAYSGINDNGLVTGYTLAGFEDFIIDATGHYTYFNVPYLFPPIIADFAFAINNSGVVVGSYAGLVPGGSGLGAFVRDASGQFTTFVVPGLPIATTATGINDSGAIVGYYLESGTEQGFLRSSAGTIQTLDVPGAIQTQLNGINDNGEIVGSATINGITEGFLASAPQAIPEPSSWVAMVTGLIAILLIQRMAGATGATFLWASHRSRAFPRQPCARKPGPRPRSSSGHSSCADSPRTSCSPST